MAVETWARIPAATKFYNFNTERYMFGFTHESPMDSRSYKGVNQNHSLLQIFYFPPRLCCEHHACLSRCMTMMLPVYILKLMQQHKLQQTQSFFFSSSTRLHAIATSSSSSCIQPQARFVGTRDPSILSDRESRDYLNAQFLNERRNK